MADRITEILEAHIRLAERQLELMKQGVDFSLIEERPGVTVIPITIESITERIERLRAQIARHESRNA